MRISWLRMVKKCFMAAPGLGLPATASQLLRVAARNTSSRVGWARLSARTRRPSERQARRIASPASSSLSVFSLIVRKPARRRAPLTRPTGPGRSAPGGTGATPGRRPPRSRRRTGPGPRAAGGRRALGDDPALVDDEHPVAGHLDLGQDVAGDEDGHPPAQAGDQVAHDQDLVGVEADRRLVHDDDGRLGQDGLGDPDALAEPLGELADDLVADALQVAELEDLVDPRAQLARGTSFSLPRK
jgi:hypothetical protein